MRPTDYNQPKSRPKPPKSPVKANTKAYAGYTGTGAPVPARKPAPTVLVHIHKISQQRHATPKELKAAVETGLVESNLQNLPGGDRDSAGWRQERKSLYPDPTNLDASIARFFNETHNLKGKYGRAGDLAAAVQRPEKRYRGRYQQRSAQADALLRTFLGIPS